MQERSSKVLLETGTARGGRAHCIAEGCSTLILSEWARDHEALLYSVDVDEKALKTAKNCLEDSRNHVLFFESDSISFLKHFDKNIDFLYLDSLDFDPLDPRPSQLHHLQEIQAAYPLLTDNSIVMIDDCDLVHGGKGKLVMDYLLDRDWKIAAKKYQAILVKK